MSNYVHPRTLPLLPCLTVVGPCRWTSNDFSIAFYQVVFKVSSFDSSLFESFFEFYVIETSCLFFTITFIGRPPSLYQFSQASVIDFWFVKHFS